MTQQQALRAVVSAVVDACKVAGPMGAPGGVLYAALMTQGCTHSQFVSLMGCLERSGLVTKDGECYHVTDAGRTFQA